MKALIEPDGNDRRGPRDWRIALPANAASSRSDSTAAICTAGGSVSDLSDLIASTPTGSPVSNIKLLDFELITIAAGRTM